MSTVTRIQIRTAYFVALFFCCPFFLVAQKNNAVHQLIIQKQLYDSLRIQQMKSLVVYTKIIGKTDLVKFDGNEWPDSVEYSYNMLKNKSGKILLISVYPYSESGDWFVGFTHYFDEHGKTFAFERLTSFYNSLCTDDMATETIVKYYNPDLKLLHSTYSLTGPNNVPLQKSKCEFPYKFDYKVYKTVAEVLKENNIPE